MTSNTLHATPSTRRGDTLSVLSRHDLVRTLPTALRNERIKLSTIRSNRAILILTASIGAIASFSIAKWMTDDFHLISDAFVFSTLFTSMIASVAGILIFTSEVQHGTLTPTLTAQPTRWVVAFSKMQMAALFGGLLGLAGMAAGLVGALVGGLEVGSVTTILTTAMWGVLYTSVAAVLGLGVGLIARHSSVAIAGLLIWALVIESLIFTFVPEEFSRFLPFLAGDKMLAIEFQAAETDLTVAVLTRGQGALVFGLYAAVAIVIGTVLFRRRDVN
jgi:ABC-2 type transport system permease protein